MLTLVSTRSSILSHRYSIVLFKNNMISCRREIEDEVVDDSEPERDPPLRRRPSGQGRTAPFTGMANYSRETQCGNSDVGVPLVFSGIREIGALCFFRFSFLSRSLPSKVVHFGVKIPLSIPDQAIQVPQDWLLHLHLRRVWPLVVVASSVCSTLTLDRPLF